MILTGSMPLSGSILETLPVGVLFFEKDGDMRLMLVDDKNSQDAGIVLLVSEFFQYALSKDEWMKEFIQKSVESAGISKNKTRKPFLKLIHGGLSHFSGSDDGAGDLLN